MRFLLGLIVIAAALWSGYWFVASSSVKGGFESWFAELQAEGWGAEYADLSVQGFPNRIDTTFTDLALADPGTGLAWDAPMFQINALSYRPNHVIAVWPEDQRIATPCDTFALGSTDMRASLVLGPDSDLTLARLILTANGVAIAPADGSGTTRVSALRLAAERGPANDAPSYRLGLSADGVAPALPLRISVDPTGALPDTLDALNADLTVTFDRPWDRHAIEEARPQPRRIKLRLAEARWGPLELQAAGDLQVDARGQPTGSITVKARNWRDILDLTVNSGALPPGFTKTLKDGVSLISQMAGNPRTLDIPLDFRRGQVFLGPVPLGPAPVVHLR